MSTARGPDLLCVWHGGVTQDDTGTKGELLPRFILPTVFRLERAPRFETIGSVYWLREDEIGKPVRLKPRPHPWRRAYDEALAARKLKQGDAHHGSRSSR